MRGYSWVVTEFLVARRGRLLMMTNCGVTEVSDAAGVLVVRKGSLGTGVGVSLH